MHFYNFQKRLFLQCTGCRRSGWVVSLLMSFPFWWVSYKKIILLLLYVNICMNIRPHSDLKKRINTCHWSTETCSKCLLMPVWPCVSRGTSYCPWREHLTGIGPDKCLQLSLSLWVWSVKFIIWKNLINLINSSPSSAWVLGIFCLGLNKVQAKVYASLFSTVCGVDKGKMSQKC